jgi:ATP-dependent helicase/nuclease subunit A
MKPTSQQMQVMEAPCGNILVSAAAGSGKTTVMTARIVGRILSSGMDIRNILVMTFTDAAARSMREKIEQALRKELQDHKDPAIQRHLYRQILLLNQSNISTIHSFCLEVIRNFYYEATGPNSDPLVLPGFGIEDSAQAEILLSSVIDTVFENHYEQCDEDCNEELSRAFWFLTDAFGSARSDQPLKELIRAFYAFLRSMPNYTDWIEKAHAQLCRDAEDIDRSAWYGKIRQGLSLRLQNAKEGALTLKEYLDCQPRLYKDYKKNEETLAQYRSFIGYLERMDLLTSDPETGWDDFYRYFLTMPALPRLIARGDYVEEKAAISELVRKHFAELICYTTGQYSGKSAREHFLVNTACVFYGPKERIQSEIKQMLPGIGMLVQLIQEIDHLYAEQKRERNRIDFSDFEHLALLILQKKPVQEYYNKKFCEIYIDEYQDTSSIQESILAHIAANNCFMVGDVKQSIYRFRHAKPQIFLDKYKRYGCEDNIRPEGTVYELNTNFRSGEEILDAVNEVFYQLMSEKVGEIEYDWRQALNAGTKEREGKPCSVELMLTDTAGRRSSEDDADPKNSETETETETETDPTDEDLSGYEAEAQTIALEIHRLLKEGEYTPGEIAILARTGPICNTCAEALKQLAIPAECEQGSTFMDRYELKVLEALLQICDNPMQDIPLVSVMLSPIPAERFLEEELLRIRIKEKEQSYFFESARLYAENTSDDDPDGPLKDKLLRWFDQLRQWRQELTYRSISDWLAERFASSGLFAHASMASHSDSHVRAVEETLDWIRSIEDRRGLNLHELVDMMKDIREKNSGKSPYGIEESRSDAVKVMTLHKSKGLEFPVVFLAGSHRNISAGRSKEYLIYSEEAGIGFYHIRPDEQYRYAMPHYLAMKEEMLYADTAEEMRLLYVGMTRAMHRLYLTGAFNSSDASEGKGIAKWFDKARQYDQEKPLPPHVVLSAKTYLDWIGMAIARDPTVDPTQLGIAKYQGNPVIPGKPEDGGVIRWKISVHRCGDYSKQIRKILSDDRKDLQEESDRMEEVINRYDRALRQEDLVDAIQKKYFSEKPYPDASVTPFKISVSEIKRREQEQAQEGDQGWIRGINTTLHPMEDVPDAPLEGTALGIAVHSALRYVTADCPGASPDYEKVSFFLENLAQSGRITVSEHRGLQDLIPDLTAYFQSDLAVKVDQAMRENQKSLYKEIPFTLKMEAARLYRKQGYSEDDFVLVQGIIDCWYEDEGQAVLIDYKTDRLFGNDAMILQELQKRYGTQLSVYAEAIRRIRGLEVKNAIIWLIRAHKAFEIRIDHPM